MRPPLSRQPLGAASPPVRPLRESAVVSALSTTPSIKCWDIDGSVSLSPITEWCLARRGVDRLLLTARAEVANPRMLDEPRVDTTVLKLFGDTLLETFWASAWPGTQVFEGGASKIYILRFDESVRRRIVAAQKRLPAWTQWSDPPLPADMCLYKTGDPLPTLVSVTHEGEGWFGAWLFDRDADAAPFASPAKHPLPLELLPPPPEFVVRAPATRIRKRSRRVR